MAYPDGNTNTSGGLVVTREEVFVIAGGDRPNIPNVAIVVTDGKSTRDTELTVPNAVRLRQESDVSIYAKYIQNTRMTSVYCWNSRFRSTNLLLFLIVARSGKIYGFNHGTVWLMLHGFTMLSIELGFSVMCLFGVF